MMRAFGVVTLLFYLTLGAVFYWVYQQLNRSSCDTPLPYRIGLVDGAFDVRSEEVANYAREAAAAWNSALGRTLLQEQKDAELVIRLVYDQRQARTNLKQSLVQQVEARKTDLDNLKYNFEQIKQEYERLRQSFDMDQARFQARLNDYNAQVSQINRMGGADQYTISRLEQQRNDLEGERRLLDSQVETLRLYENRLSSYSADHNRIVDDVQQKVSEINQDVGKEFQEGSFNPKTNEIIIYEYKDRETLRRVLAHEMGHALGVGHVTDEKSVMYYLNNRSELKLSAQDIQALKQVCKLE